MGSLKVYRIILKGSCFPIVPTVENVTCKKKKVLRGWDVTSGMCEKSYYSRKQTKNEEPLDSIWLANIATLICSWKYLKNYNILKENHIWDSMHVCITEDSQKKGHWN